MSFFQELKRRNVFRVGAAYVVVGWLIVQVVETIFPAFGFGDAAVRIVTIVLAIGLVPVLVFAWVFELTPEGLKKEKDVDRSQSITPHTGKRLDRTIMVVLALALAYFAFDKFVLSGSREASIAQQAHQEGRTEALVESYGEKSIAVLPFDAGFAKCREATERALAIDPDYAQAHSWLGWIAQGYGNDLAQAARHFERALRLDPSDNTIIGNAAGLMFRLGRPDEALALGEYDIAHDPVNPVGHANLGFYYFSAGRLDEAIASGETAIRLNPGYIGAHYFIGTALLLKGEAGAALARMQQEPFEEYRLLGQVMAYHALGDAEASDKMLEEFVGKYEKEWAYNIAYALAYRNEADRAFEWLDKAVEYGDPGLSEIVVSPLFANIETDPRWLPFLESIGKSPEQLNAIGFEVTLPGQ